MSKLTSFIALNAMTVQGDGDEGGEGGGSDIGALLGNLGPLIGGLSGVSSSAQTLFIQWAFSIMKIWPTLLQCY